MAKNVFVYNLTPRDAAWHSDIVGPGYFEWWYLDGMFEEGYEIGGLLHAARGDTVLGGLLGGTAKTPEEEKWPNVSFRITTPDNQAFELGRSYRPETFKASADTCDVNLGGNTFVGKFRPNGLPEEFRLKVADGDMGLDLVYKVMVTGVKLADRDGGYTYYHPIKKTCYGWYPVSPRSRIEGTITLKGKKISVHGEGYQDHQLGNYSTADVMPIEFWGHIYAGDYTMVWTDSFAGENKGYRHFSPFILWKGNKPILNTYDFMVIPEKWELEPETRMPAPVVETLRATDGKTSVRIVLPPGKLIERVRYVGGKRFTEDSPGAYFRWVTDAQVEITRGDEVETVTGMALHEHMWHTEWFPYRRVK